MILNDLRYNPRLQISPYMTRDVRKDLKKDYGNGIFTANGSNRTFLVLPENIPSGLILIKHGLITQSVAIAGTVT